MNTAFDFAFRAVIAGSLLFMSYVAYGFHADRVAAKDQYEKGAAMREHCRIMRSLGKTPSGC